MDILEMETLRVLVKSSDISALGLLKRSSSAKFFEDATRFTKVILKSLIILHLRNPLNYILIIKY